MKQRNHIGVVTSLLGFFAVLLGEASAVTAQPRFGIEAGAGQNLAVTSYVDNVIVVQEDVPLLGDESPGSGFAAGANLVFAELEATLRLRFFDRSEFSIHHRGRQRLPENRIRPDGSVDDSGMTYEPVEPTRTIEVPDRTRGDLLIVSLGAGYRWYVVTGDVDVFFPVGGSIVVTHVQEDARPYVFGLEANGGAGVTWKVASPVGLFAAARAHAMVTPTYTRTSDAARHAVLVGDTTEEAVASSMIHGSLILGIQFTVR